MGKRIHLIWLFLLAVLMMVLPHGLAQAEESREVPAAAFNLNNGGRRSTYLVASPSGYTRVFCRSGQVFVEEYDLTFRFLSRTVIPMELEYWGGFYANEDAYYLIEGAPNTEEDDAAEVIRIIRYDHNWQRTGAAVITGNTGLFGGQVRYPFDYGCVEIAECGGYLYIVTGHQGYVDSSVGMGHQGFLMVKVDPVSMTGSIVMCDLWHSFSQYIAVEDGFLYVLEQNDGSRQTQLTKIIETDLEETLITVLKYGGTHTSSWAIPCYASADDLAISSQYVISVGTSIDQTLYDEVTEETPHNLLLTLTPKSAFSTEATTVKWITNSEEDGKCFLGAEIVKISDTRFLLMWEEFESEQQAEVNDPISGYVLHYCFLDEKGDAVSEEFTAPAPVSDCHPILVGNQIVYCASNENTVDFYTIDAFDGSFHKYVNRTAGLHASWEISEETLFINGSGPIETDPEVHYRRPLSSCRGGYSYSSSENCWKHCMDSVKKIIIDDDITAIPANEFRYFKNLTEVEVGWSMQTIGASAFERDSSLRKVVIRSFDAVIGEDAFWSGYLPANGGTHLVWAEIYCFEGSPADAYVTENGISHTYLDSCPVITEQPGEISGTVGETARLAVKATGYRLTYQWQYSTDDGSSWHVWSNNQNSGVSIRAEQNGWLYRCVVRETNNAQTISDTVRLTVKTCITEQPGSLSGGVGDLARLTISATGAGLTYQWQYSKNNGETWQFWSNNQNSGIRIQASQNGYLYRCVITDANGSQTVSDTVRLQVTGGPEITAQPGAIRGAVGDLARLTISAAGNGLTYQWQYSANDGSTWQFWSSNQNSGIRIQANQNGCLFRCVITDANGLQAISDVVQLEVLTGAVITEQPGALNGAVGETVRLTINATGNGLTCQWQYSTNNGESWIVWSNNQISGVSIREDQNGWLYRCVITDADNIRVISNSVRVTVKTVITEQSGTLIGAVGDLARLTVGATGAGLTYQWQYSTNNGESWIVWSNNQISGVRIQAAQNGYLFRCVITDANAVKTYSNTERLTVLTGAVITEQPGALNGAIGETVRLTISATGNGLTYQWQYSTNNGESWTVWSNNQNSGVSIRAEQNGWLYRCVVTDANGNKTYSNTVQVTVKTVITEQPGALSGAVGDLARLTISATGVGLTYQWQYSTDNGTTWQYWSSNQTSGVRIQAGQNGWMFRCVITDANGGQTVSNTVCLMVEA